MVLALSGCFREVGGTAGVGSRQADPAFFFSGAVPAYGQTLSANDTTMLAYLRALRRIDVCGLLNRESLAKVGEIGSVGTLFAFDECDIDIKVPGETNRRFVSVKLTLARTKNIAVAFRVDDMPVYETYPDSCDYLLPLDLSTLPGAQPLRKPDQPYVQLGLIAGADCDFAEQVVRAAAGRIAADALPARDAVATYPAALAERDPCQVLSVLGTDVDHWNINLTRPYECDFDVWRDGYADVVSIQLSLEPQIVDIATDSRDRRDSEGVELYIDERFCSAVAFVGAPMQRKVIGGDFVSLGDVVIAPAVVVDGSGDDCAAVTSVATAAAKLYK